MIRLWAIVFGALGLSLATRTVCAQDIIVDHPPLNTGGPAADTLFLNDFGQVRYQQLADDFFLKTPASIRRLVWWGFYGTDNTPNPHPPLGDETMRVRFYDARPTDGLPGAILREESFLNPSRVATGRVIGLGDLPAEFRFQADLSIPLELSAGVSFWVEFVQVGDAQSLFRLEASLPQGNGGFAFQNLNVPDWTRSPGPDLAFQLSTIPEPDAVLLALLIAHGVPFHRWRGRNTQRIANQACGITQARTDLGCTNVELGGEGVFTHATLCIANSKPFNGPVARIASPADLGGHWRSPDGPCAVSAAHASAR